MLHALWRAWSWVRGRETGTEQTDADAVELCGGGFDERSSVKPIGGDELRVRAALTRIGGVL